MTVSHSIPILSVAISGTYIIWRCLWDGLCKSSILGGKKRQRYGYGTVAAVNGT